MFEFFLNKDYPIQHAIKKYTMFEYITRRYQAEITKITLYYRNRYRATNNTNLFNRIITLMSPDLELDIADYFKYTDANTKYITRQFDFTSNISMGKVHENVFYANNEYVIINHVDTDINIFKLREDWINKTPIRIIYTNETDLDFYVLDKKKETLDTTITIVEVNTTLMLMMYRFWAINQIKEGRATNPNYFVATILLPNMIKTMVDHVLFNRLRKLFYGEKIRNFDINHPFNVIDYSSRVDGIYRNVLDDIHNVSAPLEKVLYTIPTIIYPTIIDALFINRPIYTRRSEWAIWVARLEYMLFLIDLLGEKGVARNREYIYRLPVRIRELENRSTTIVDKLPNEMICNFNYCLEEIKRKIGRR